MSPRCRNYIITVFSIEWAILLIGFWMNVSRHRQQSEAGTEKTFPSIPISVNELIFADYTAATVLISFGAVIGRVSAMQCLIMMFFEVRHATVWCFLGRQTGSEAQYEYEKPPLVAD